MSAIENYFVHMASDFDHLLTGQNFDDNVRDNRIVSLALRVLGGFVAVIAITSFVGSLATFSISPITSAVGLASALLVGFLALDLIKMGDNMRRICNAADIGARNQGIFDHLMDAGRAIFDVVPAAWYEAQHGVPYVFRGTILFDPALRFINKIDQ